MDAKDLRTEAALGERSSDGTSKYTHAGTALPCSGKSYHDVSSNPLAKMDTPTSRPCAVIGPDRVLPPSTNSDAYLKKSHYEPWPPTESTYRPPEYPHKMPTYQCPIRNISPRQTYQENMQRIMVPPTYNSVKISEDANFVLERNAALAKSNKLVGPAESKYCDVPYSVNPISENHKNTEMCVSNANSTRNCPPVWHPGGVNIRPARPYGAPELYQFPEYASCAGPRQMPMTRPPRAHNEDTRHLYTETYYHHGANLRFKPYPNIKERYPQTRYEYVNNYQNPFHPPPAFPSQKYDFQKSVSSHSSYPQVPVKYMENRITDSVMDGYQRSNQQINYNVPYQNQMIHPAYGPMLANGLPNKFYQYPPDSSIKAVPANKLPFENSKLYLEHDSSRNKGYSAPENFYMNEMVRPHIKSQVLMSNYPTMNMQPMTHPYYRKESHSAKGYEYIPQFRHVDPMANNHMNKMIAQFSPNAVAISPSDSSISNDTAHTLGNSLEDFGYVSQSSNASIRSVESGTNRIMPSDMHRRYNYGYPSMVRTSPLSSKLHLNANNTTNSKDTKGIDVRQFLQMWNEGDEESANNQRENVTQTDYNHISSKSTSYCEGKTQEQLYVLGLVNVPSEELGKYEHIQKVSKLPDNIKGYNNVELLKHFEEAFESSNLSNFNMRKTPTPRNFQPTKPLMMPGTLMPTRPVSPLDVEAKISQSVIHKEVGCNFEIKPCSPQMLNVEVATPAQNILEERVIEKVSNPYKSPSISNISDSGRNCNNTKQEQVMMLNESSKIPSCKLVNTQCSNNDVANAIRTDYILQDLESDAGVCFASLPRLDNDIELNFPEVNQQFINANKESVITSHDLQKTSFVSNPNFNNDSTNNNFKTNISTKITPTRDSEKEFVKLSKYRKNKKFDADSKERQSITSSQFLRTDSVIIKNPENTKCYEDSPDFLPNVKYSDIVEHDSKSLSPLNTLETNVELPKIDDIATESVNEIAVDFSLNKSENILKTKINKDNNLDNRSLENMPSIENDILECNENTEPLVSYNVAIPPKSYNKLSLTIVEKGDSETITQIENVIQESSQNQELDKNKDKNNFTIQPDSYKSFESSTKNDKNLVSNEDVNKMSNLSKTNDLYLSTFFNEAEHNHVPLDSNNKMEKTVCSDFSLTQLETGSDKTSAVSTFDSDKTPESVQFYSDIKNTNSDSNSHHQIIDEENIVHKSDNLRDDLFSRNSPTDIGKNETANSNIIEDTACESISNESNFAIQIKDNKSDSHYQTIDKQKTFIVHKSEKTSNNSLQNCSAVIVKDDTSIVYKSQKNCGNDIRNCIAVKMEDETTHCDTLHFASDSVLTKPNSAAQIQYNESDSGTHYQLKATNDEVTCIKHKLEKNCGDGSNSQNVCLEDSARESNSTELDIATHIVNNESDSDLHNQSKTINKEGISIVSKSENISDDVSQNCSAVEDQYKTVHSKNLKNNAYESVSTKPDIETKHESNSCSPNQVEAVNEKDLCILFKSENHSDDVFQNCSAVKDQYKTVNSKNLDNNAYESVSTKPDIETQNESSSCSHHQVEVVNEKDLCILLKPENFNNDVCQNFSTVKDQYKTVYNKNLDNNAYKSVSTKPNIETQNESNTCLHNRAEAVNKEGLCILLKSEKHNDEVLQNCSTTIIETDNTAHETVSTIATQIENNLSDTGSHHQSRKDMNKIDTCIVLPNPNKESDDSRTYSTGLDENETAYLKTFNNSAYETITTEQDMTTQIEKNQLSSQHHSITTNEYACSLPILESISSDVSQNCSAVKDQYKTVYSENLDNNAYESVSTKPNIETQNESNTCLHHQSEAVNKEGLCILLKSEKHNDEVLQNCSTTIIETDNNETLQCSAHETVSTIATQIENNLSDTGSHHQSRKEMNKIDTCIVAPNPNKESDDSRTYSTGLDENETAYLKTFNNSAYETITTEQDMTTQIEKNQLSSQHHSITTNEYACSLPILESISGDVSQNCSAALDGDAKPTILNEPAYKSVTSVYEDTFKSLINTYRSKYFNLRKELFSPWIQKLFWSEGHTLKQKPLIQYTNNLNESYYNSPVIDGSDITNKISSNIDISVAECSDFSSNVSEMCHLSSVREQIFDTPYNTKSKDMSNESSFKDQEPNNAFEIDKLSKIISIKEKVVEDSSENVKIATRQQIATKRDNETLSKLQEMKQGSNSFLEVNDEVNFKCVFEKPRITLKRSLSESAIGKINTDTSEDFGNGPSAWTKKRRKINEFLQVCDPHFITESVSNTQNNRRNSISSIYNEENLSFCIVIENDCIITQENEEEEKICFAEISEDCVSEIQAHIIEEDMVPTSEIFICPEEENCEFSEPYVLEVADEKSLEQSWVDDIGCVETVVSDDIAEDVTISAPSTPKEDDMLENDDSDIFNNTYEHTDKVKYIYGGKMCNDDAEFVETLYRTPQMNVNRTLSNRESHVPDNFVEFDESNSLEDYFKSNVEFSSKTELHSSLGTNTNNSCLASSNKGVDNSHESPEDITEHNNSPRNNLVSHDVYLLNSSFKETFNLANNSKMDELLDIKVNNAVVYLDQHIGMSSNTQSIKKTQDDTVNSCESSIDNVFSYNQESDSTNNLNTPNSPEVSSTTSEEKSSSILLKITNYKGMRTSQLNKSNSDNNCSNCCKFTENISYLNYNNSSNPRPLITKAAQKYIPPIQEPMDDLKVKLPLPHQSLLKLKQLKITNAEKKHIVKPKKEMLVKPKPRFEDVLKSIDEIQFKKHKEKTKKPKKVVPKVVIKKSENGSHYASMHKKDYYNPDLTGRKWQPWVFIEKNNFIDKMAIKNKTKAIYNHRKNTYVFADKFQKYKSVSSAKFVISQPKLDDTSVGQLKYTIRLKHTY